MQEQIATFDMDHKDGKGSPVKPIVFFTKFKRDEEKNGKGVSMKYKASWDCQCKASCASGSLCNSFVPYHKFKPVIVKIWKCFMKFPKKWTHNSR